MVPTKQGSGDAVDVRVSMCHACSGRTLSLVTAAPNSRCIIMECIHFVVSQVTRPSQSAPGVLLLLFQGRFRTAGVESCGVELIQGPSAVSALPQERNPGKKPKFDVKEVISHCQSAGAKQLGCADQSAVLNFCRLPGTHPTMLSV